MPDLRIEVVSMIVPDDGRDGIFFRAGEKWLRERGKEYRLLDIAPHLERQALLQIAISDSPFDKLEQRALDASRNAASPREEPTR